MEFAEAVLGPAKTSVMEHRRLCCATVGALLASPPLPRIQFVAVDDAGIIQIADLCFMVLNVLVYLIRKPAGSIEDPAGKSFPDLGSWSIYAGLIGMSRKAAQSLSLAASSVC